MSIFSAQLLATEFSLVLIQDKIKKNCERQTDILVFNVDSFDNKNSKQRNLAPSAICGLLVHSCQCPGLTLGFFFFVFLLLCFI